MFFHAKSNTQSKLFELAHLLMKNIPADSVDKAEDIYSFVYKNGRDLSGFIDGKTILKISIILKSKNRTDLKMSPGLLQLIDKSYN